jgi:hypothetical protein
VDGGNRRPPYGDAADVLPRLWDHALVHEEIFVGLKTKLGAHVGLGLRGAVTAFMADRIDLKPGETVLDHAWGNLSLPPKGELTIVIAVSPFNSSVQRIARRVMTHAG